MISVIHWAMIGIAVISSWFGIRRGFLQEGLSLITWIAAVAIALIFADKLGTLLADLIETSSVRVGISFFILLICTLAVGGMVSNLLGNFIKMTGLTGTDKVLGMVFGFVRGGVICLVIIAGLNYWGFFKEDALVDGVNVHPGRPEDYRTLSAFAGAWRGIDPGAWQGFATRYQVTDFSMTMHRARLARLEQG